MNENKENRVFACVYIHTHKHTHIYIHTHICTCMCVYIRICLYLDIDTYMHIYGINMYKILLQHKNMEIFPFTTLRTLCYAK